LKLPANPFGDDDLVANVHGLFHLTEGCSKDALCKEMETWTLIYSKKTL
jgi:hypothetical protein